MGREKPTPDQGTTEWGVNHDLDERADAQEVGDLTGSNRASQDAATWD